MMEPQQVAVKLLKQSGVDQALLPEEIRGAVLDEVANELANRLIVVALQQLPAHELEQYVDMLSANEQINEEEAVRFLQTHIPDFTNLIQHTAAEFVQEFATAAQQA